MDTPRTNDLYRKLAKDYSPKQAEMLICKHIAALEERIAALEVKLAEKPEEKTTAPKKRKEA